MSRASKLISFARQTVIGPLALFVVLGGGAYAATKNSFVGRSGVINGSAVRARRLLFALPAAVSLMVVSSAGAREPRITVPIGHLRSALVCQHSVMRATRTPVLLLPPTANDGSELYPHGLQVSLTRAGIPSCYVNFPQHTMGDLQINVQYVVYAIRTVYGRAGREIAVYGLSQGALLPRFALIYWPSLRRMVSDAVLVSGDQHGTTFYSDYIAAVCSRPGCRLAATIWQQAAGSNLLRAINRQGRDPTPGPTAWTTVHSLTDEIALPASGPHPTAVLPGASNLIIQNICPGRHDFHTATAFDSVSYAALIDAITHPGPARSARISRTVCRHPYAPGLDPQRTAALIAQINAAADPRFLHLGVMLPREPAVRRWVRTR